MSALLKSPGNGIKKHFPDVVFFQQMLSFGLIAAPGALAALVHGLARYLDDVRQDVLWVRDQFVPITAEDQHISLHGESRAVPRTRFDTSARYRARVEYAAKWHKLGGKVQGLPEILAEYGFSDGKIHNKRQDDPALWAHFDVNLLNPPKYFESADVDAVFALANQYKPGRSVISKIQFAKEHCAPLALAAVALTAVTVDHYVKARAARPPGPAVLSGGAAIHTFITFDHWVRTTA
jgi:hypothetical protein